MTYATDSGPPVHIQRAFPVSPETLFEAWTQPHVIRRWLFIGEGTERLDVRANARPDGVFFIREWNTSAAWNHGAEIDHFGVYQTVEYPNRLVFTLEVPAHFAGLSVCTVLITPTGGGCLMTFIQSGVDRQLVSQSWQEMFNTLTHVLEDMVVERASLSDAEVAKDNVKDLIHLNPAREPSERTRRHA